MFPVPCEAIFNRHDEVARSALVGVNMEPIIVIEQKPKTAKQPLTEELLILAAENELTRRIKTVLFYDVFSSRRTSQCRSSFTTA